MLIPRPSVFKAAQQRHLKVGHPAVLQLLRPCSYIWTYIWTYYGHTDRQIDRHTHCRHSSKRVRNAHGHNTRGSSTDLIRPSFGTDMGMNSFYYHATKMWNEKCTCLQFATGHKSLLACHDKLPPLFVCKYTFTAPSIDDFLYSMSICFDESNVLICYPFRIIV